MIRQERYLCPVCGEQHDCNNGELLALPEVRHLEDVDIVGWKMCAKHDALFDDDYVFIVGVDMRHMNANTFELNPNNVVLDGSHCAMPEDDFTRIFNGMPVPPWRLLYAPSQVIITLAGVLGSSGGATHKGNATTH